MTPCLEMSCLRMRTDFVRCSKVVADEWRLLQHERVVSRPKEWSIEVPIFQEKKWANFRLVEWLL